MDGDMVPVDVWQLANWPSRWERAVNEMQVWNWLGFVSALRIALACCCAAAAMPVLLPVQMPSLLR